MSRRRRREFILAIGALLILWLIWQKVHIVLWVAMPWWLIPVLIVGALVVLDLALDRLFGRDG